MITVETSSYILYFDNKGQRLNRIYLQEGGSRDGKFRKEMSMEEVCALFDSELVYEEDGEDSGIYWAQEAVNGNRLGFIFENDLLWSVFEEPFE